MNALSRSVVAALIFIVLKDHSKVVGAYYGKEIGALRTYAHQVRGNLYAADDNTLFLTEFNYDGTGPDAFVWMGNTNNPSSQGTIIPVDGRPAVPEAILEGYSNAVVRLELPTGKTLADYKWLSIWCRKFGANFGDILIPSGSIPVPKSLGTLGFNPRVHNVFADEVIVLNNRQIKLVNLDYDGNGPEAYYWAGTGGTPSIQGFALSRDGSLAPLPRGSPLTDVTVTLTIPEDRGDIFDIGHFGLWCDAARQDFGHVDLPSAVIMGVPRYEVAAPPVTAAPPTPPTRCKVLLADKYQVKWTLSDTAIQVSLSGQVEPGTYMSFGLSGSNTRTQMVQSDTVVTWIDKVTGQPQAVDYFLSAYQPCVAGSGACPDTMSNPPGSNDVTIIESSSNNGIITIKYEKQLSTSDSNADKVIPTNQPVYVVWAIGPFNPDGLVAKHRLIPQPGTSVAINFGETDEVCPPLMSGDTPQLPVWEIPALIGDETKMEFQLDIGQAGGQRGYEGITGAPGWGITWYVDNLMIPIITLKRGVTYTFNINGGNNSGIQARYHPFYITDDPEGGYFQKTEQQRQGINIYAGPVEGSMCEWQNSGSTQDPDTYSTFEQYRDTLQRVCDQPVHPGVMTWTPDENTPTLVYYQCYTHKFLGWKMYIVDETPATTQKPPATAATTASATSSGGDGAQRPMTTESGAAVGAYITNLVIFICMSIALII